MTIEIVFLLFAFAVALILMEFAFEKAERRQKKRDGKIKHRHA